MFKWSSISQYAAKELTLQLYRLLPLEGVITGYYDTIKKRGDSTRMEDGSNLAINRENAELFGSNDDMSNIAKRLADGITRDSDPSTWKSFAAVCDIKPCGDGDAIATVFYGIEYRQKPHKAVYNVKIRFRDGGFAEFKSVSTMHSDNGFFSCILPGCFQHPSECRYMVVKDVVSELTVKPILNNTEPKPE